MKIKFTHDFQGVLVYPHFYAEGTEISLDADTAHELIRLGHAVAVENDPPKTKPILPKEKPEGSTGATRKTAPRKAKPKAQVKTDGS